MTEQANTAGDEMKPASDREGDPVWVNSKGFWFFEETWAVCHGPWDTEAEARTELSAYAETL